MAHSERPLDPPWLPCACASLRRAARAVTQLYDGELRDEGLNVAQFTLLRVLSEHEAIAQGRLGDVLALDTTTLSRTLRPLEARRFVRRRPGADRRERRLELTPAGRDLLARAEPAWERAQQRLRRGIGAATWPRLLEALAGLAGAARRA